MDLSFLSNIHISTTSVAWVVFSIVMIIWLSISTVLLYHWHTYGMKNKVIVFIETIYLAVSLTLIVLAFVSIFLI